MCCGFSIKNRHKPVLIAGDSGGLQIGWVIVFIASEHVFFINIIEPF